MEFTQKAQKALMLAKKKSKENHHNYIGTEHILVGLLREGNGTAAKVLTAMGVEEKKLMILISDLIAPNGDVVLKERAEYSKSAQNVIANSHLQAEKFHSEKTGTEHLLLAMIVERDCVATRLLLTMGINLQKLCVEILTSMGVDPAVSREYFQSGRSNQQGSHQTPILDRFSRDLTDFAREGQLDPVIGREREIQRIVRILSRRTKNNPCLIGEPGVGKTAIAEGLAVRIAEGNVPEAVQDKRVVNLDLSGMVAGSKYRGEFEERIKRVIEEVKKAGNILLFMDEIHTVIGAGGAEGAIDASNILKPSLARGELQLIGATTLEEYRKYIEKDAALERRFQPVMVEEPSREEAVEILEGLRSRYEAHHNVTITDEAIKSAVSLSIRYINDRFLPDKALDLIDEAASKVRLEGFKSAKQMEQLMEESRAAQEQLEQALSEGNMEEASQCRQQIRKLSEHVNQLKTRQIRENSRKKPVVDQMEIAEIVSSWTRIPIKKLEEKESVRLKNLEKTLHKRVIAQEEAVTSVAKAVKRGRVGLKDPKRPIGSFLFLGPTGVGKTELSKALAEAVFGSENNIIRVDMSEYMEKHSVSKMIGSPPGYVGHEDGGQLSEKVRRNPYSVVLFDEIEKAHPDVFNVLLQVLDDGHITDSHGRKVSFKDTIIIMTSNAGAQSIIEPKNLGFTAVEDEKADYERMKNNVMEEVRRMFKPEFLNRIDETIVFHSLNKEHMKKIVTLLCKNLIERCEKQMQIHLQVRDSAKKFIVEKGYDVKYGARPLRRKIQTEIEDKLVDEILDGNIKENDTVAVSVRQDQIAFSVKSSGKEKIVEENI